ncbi:MAG: methyltransferase domain-containing protein [Stellaceae bacterium]
MSDQTANFVGDIPEHYDREMGPVIFVDFADDMARRVAAGAPARVLELATGTGIVTRRLRDLLPATSRLTATDLNPPMLDVARGKFRAGEAVEFQAADATDLPFPDGGFDAVVCQFGVMFFPDKEKSYSEAYRVLAPGGRYLFSVWDAHRHNPYGRIAHELIATFFPADPLQFYRVPLSYHVIDPIKDALGEAGFVDFRATVLSHVKEVGNIAPFARGFVYGNPTIEQIKARGGVDPEAVVAAMEAAYRREWGSNPSRMPLQAILIEARRP